jgi:hypothetical protein
MLVQNYFPSTLGGKAALQVSAPDDTKLVQPDYVEYSPNISAIGLPTTYTFTSTLYVIPVVVFSPPPHRKL